MEFMSGLALDSAIDAPLLASLQFMFCHASFVLLKRDVMAFFELALLARQNKRAGSHKSPRRQRPLFGGWKRQFLTPQEDVQKNQPSTADAMAFALMQG
jgi:hypothetical protein